MPRRSPSTRPVGDGVHGVARWARETKGCGLVCPVGRQARSGEGSGAQRALVRPRSRVAQPSDVAFQGRAPSQEMVGQGDRLRPLQMRVAGHDRFLVLRREIQDRPHRGEHRLGSPVKSPDYIKPKRYGDLVVSRTARVDSFPCLAEPPCEFSLNEGMNILAFRIDVELPAAASVNMFQRERIASASSSAGCPDAPTSGHGRWSILCPRQVILNPRKEKKEKPRCPD